MTALDAWRAQQRDHIRLTSDNELELFLNTIDPATIALERLAHASPWEINTARHIWRHA